MGIGDEIMAAGQAQAWARRMSVGSVSILGIHGMKRWVPLWERTPHVARLGDEASISIVNGPGVRPYIAAKSETQWVWQDYQPDSARIDLTTEEMAFAAQFADAIVIEPTVKPKAPPNKQWSWARWCELVRTLKHSGRDVVQVGPERGTCLVPGVRHAITPTIFHALAVVKRSSAYVGHEGALHHGAAAMGAPAVVVMGGYISPRQTGYALSNHRYLFTGGQPCGMRVRCKHCEAAMRAISTADILSALNEVIR